MIGFEREDDEIVRYYEKIAPADQFGIWGTELMLRLPLKTAERFMKKDHGWTEETWQKSMLKKDHESIVNEVEDYFQFAWEKAVGHRGVSANRSVIHYLAWSWLLNDMELFKFLMEPHNYANYGCPMLLAVAHKYELLDLLPSNPLDYEVFMNMAQGRPCLGSSCSRGCGRGKPGEFRPIALLVPPNGKVSGLILPK